MSAQKTGGPDVVIPLKNGGTALVSYIDSENILKSQWRQGTNGYIYRVGGRVAGVQCLLHRIVVSAEVGQDVHHKNEDKADCRRKNLEVLSKKEHQAYHSHVVTMRNIASRKYSITAECKACGKEFTKHPDHRGRQIYCSMKCVAARNARKGIKNA